ncbi:MAG: ATP-binding cassette domain-containing protein [Clostridia bacterium]|nr:ATP-binding cassette domain-containing protein [Clostridia bacterium]
MEYCLTVDGLSKKYRKYLALDGVTMRVPQGAIYGLVGKNGAGKTTLIRIICGLQAPTIGTYSIFGAPYNSKEIYSARRRMGGIVESPALYGNMSAKDNLKHQFMLLGKPSFDGIDGLLEMVDLKDTGKKPVRNFSLGMRQRLSIAMALASDPDFVVLDEPINGLDPQGIVEIREIIIKLNKERNITFLISSHILDELSKIATHYGFIDKGKILKEITKDQLEDNLKKRIVFKVDTAVELCSALDETNLQYKLTSPTEGELYGEISISALSDILKSRGITLIRVNEKDETLESYYINLLGGEVND